MAAAPKEIVPGWYTTEQVAEMTGYTVQRIRQLREELGGVDVSGIIYPVDKAREFAKRPRPKPGRKAKAK